MLTLTMHATAMNRVSEAYGIIFWLVISAAETNIQPRTKALKLREYVICG
jgi:hypothetical protein